MKKTTRETAADLLGAEIGTIVKHGASAGAVGYPASYRVGASSLGAQFVYKSLNAVPELSCGRFYLESDGTSARPPSVLESGRPIADMHWLAFSISCEQELLGIVRLLRAAGIAPLTEDRDDTDPPILAGGPLTTVDPRLVAPLVDIVITGSADDLLRPLGALLVAHRDDKRTLLERAAELSPRIYVPRLHGTPPTPDSPPPPPMPAAAAVWSEAAELKNLFLVEATRGCRRRCAFCTMSRDAAGSPCFHAFAVEDILAQIPEDAPGVGLVGAAVTDHPEIESLAAQLVSQGKRVSLSSIRADKLTPRLAQLLKESGLRTLTVAADGASERVRRSVRKGITEGHLLAAAALARETGFAGLKIYSMVGLPEETDDDIAEFSTLLLACAAKVRVSATVQAFVPKPGTPLADAPMAETTVLEKRLALLRKLTRGRVRILPTSPKWSVIDWKLSHGGFQAARAAIAADADGADFAAWKRAVKRYIP